MGEESEHSKDTFSIELSQLAAPHFQNEETLIPSGLTPSSCRLQSRTFNSSSLSLSTLNISNQPKNKESPEGKVSADSSEFHRLQRLREEELKEEQFNSEYGDELVWQLSRFNFNPEPNSGFMPYIC
eukprot:TRINITY_DN2727_c0_g1_i3.p1 TRINITY_DN2727_c0_g1~~TRINITY_DN2727_c0_g1_i3.p1  ORF type:complete len:127 (+),score=17.73 TRINITY_DN2727_c0_g1_i3:126-506(+)